MQVLLKHFTSGAYAKDSYPLGKQSLPQQESPWALIMLYLVSESVQNWTLRG